MRSPFTCTATAVLALVLTHEVMATSYWVDTASCKSGKAMDNVVEEMKAMAASSVKRMESTSDTDYAAIFEFIFKTDKSNKAAYDTVHDFMKDVSGTTLTTDRNSANVRIYCDEDARWKARVDPQTKQPVGGFEDPDNWIIHDTDEPTVGCNDLEEGKKFTFAETFTDPMPGTAPQAQVKDRATISMCDHLFYTTDKTGKLIPRKFQLLQDIRQMADLSTRYKLGIKGTIEVLQVEAGMTLLHEWQHTLPYDGVDEAYEWDGIQRLTAAEALNNADSYGYFGQWALLADRGYTMARKSPDGSPESVISQVQADQESGRLVRYENITKRSLQRRLARAARRIRRNVIKDVQGHGVPVIGSQVAR